MKIENGSLALIKGGLFQGYTKDESKGHVIRVITSKRVYTPEQANTESVIYIPPHVSPKNCFYNPNDRILYVNGFKAEITGTDKQIEEALKNYKTNPAELKKYIKKIE